MRLVVSTMKCWIAVLSFAGAYALFAQAPPTAAGADASVSGTISQLNYGPEMDVTSFLVNGNTLASNPPKN